MEDADYLPLLELIMRLDLRCGGGILMAEKDYFSFVAKLPPTQKVARADLWKAGIENTRFEYIAQIPTEGLQPGKYRKIMSMREFIGTKAAASAVCALMKDLPPMPPAPPSVEAR